MIRLRSLSLAVAVAFAFAPLAHAEDLLSIYHEARNSDPQLAAAEATRNATSENVAQARALLLPQLGASYSYQRAHTNNTGPQFVYDEQGNQTLVNISSSGKNFGTSFGGSLNQSILDLGQWTNLKASKAQARAGDSTYDAAEQELLIRVADAYFAVLNSQDALTFSQSNERALNRQMEQAQQRFEVGLTAITDVNDAKAQHDTSVAKVIRAQNLFDDNREALRQLTGQEVGPLKKLRKKLPLDKPQPEDPQAWVDVAVAQNPVLSSATFQLDVAAANVNTARAGHLPTLNGQILYNKSPNWGDRYSSAAGASVHTNSEQWNTTVGVSLNIPLFSGGATQSRVRQAIYNRDFAQDQLEAQRRLVERNTRSSYRAVIAGASEVEATEQAVISAQSSLDATQAGYDVGTRTIVDVLLSQQQLLQAQSSYSSARHAFVLNGLLLKQAAGIIEVKDLEAVNALLE
ncbi:MAG: TolC family outer membrane protein [Dokdonella sp.]